MRRSVTPAAVSAAVPAALAAALATALACTPAQAFKIDPWSYRPPGVSPARIESQVESFFYNPRMLLLRPIAFGARLPAAMGQLKEAAHENLTELSLRCALAPLKRSDAAPSAMISRCAGRSGPLLTNAPDLSGVQQEIIRAVRFNDSPPVKLATALMQLITPSALLCGEIRVPDNAGCWAMIMAHAGSLAATDPNNAAFGKQGNLLYRTHFGDMQFMHAMAARGETLARTHERVLLWMRFTWQVAAGEIDTTARIDSLAPEFAREILIGFEDWSVAQFFEIRGGAPEQIRRIALGALLHTVQDSFAYGHVEREVHNGDASPSEAAPRFGAIRAFHNFGCQSDEKHGEADHAAHYRWFAGANHDALSPVTLGAQIIDLLLTRKLKWNDSLAGATGGAAVSGQDVAQWMRGSVFPVVEANATRVAGAGTGFLRLRPATAAALTADAAAPASGASLPTPFECAE